MCEQSDLPAFASIHTHLNLCIYLLDTSLLLKLFKCMNLLFAHTGTYEYYSDSTGFGWLHSHALYSYVPLAPYMGEARSKTLGRLIF